MSFKAHFLLAVVAFVAADRRPTYSYSPPRESSEESYESSEAKYDFSWAVKHDYSGNDFGHQESRDGDRTEGSYYVYLPDGRLQKVTYYVDGDSGYVADVSYEGEAQYPDSDESREYSQPRPTYNPPRPTYNPPRPTYNPPRPVYNPPRPVYNPPRPTYRPPRPTYNPPRPTYSAPDSEESVEIPVYTPPRRTYGFPN